MEIKEFVINNTPIYQLQTKKFNTNLFGFSFVLPLSSKYLPELTLLAQIYTKQTKEFKTEREFSLRLNELYDSQIFYNFEKKGKVLQITFYLHIISDKFLKNTDNFVKDVFKLFEDTVFSKKIITEDLLKKEKKIYNESYQSKIDNVLYSSSILLYNAMFKNENYINHLDSTIEEINEITIESINTAYDILMSSTKFGFVIGDIDENQVKNLFKNIPSNQLLLPQFIDDETKDITNVTVKHVPYKLPQSVLILGYRTNIRVDSKQYFSMCVLNKYLGGGYESSFIREIREKHNLVYTISSEYDWYKGIMVVNSGINFDDYNTVVSLIKQCINDVKNGKVDIELLEAVKTQMISEQMEAEDNLINLIEIVNLKYFFKKQTINNEKKIDKIKSILVDDLIKAAQYLILDTIVIVGKE